jgi:hypothetical protein
MKIVTVGGIILFHVGGEEECIQDIGGKARR